MRAIAWAAEIDLLRDVLARDGSAWVREAGASMAPLLCPDDALRLVPLEGARARRGMVVGVIADGRLVVHRLVRVAHDGLVARGDAAAWSDAPVAREALVGHVAGLRTPDGLEIDFTRGAWPLFERLLGALAAWSGHSAARLPLRAVCHALARLGR